MGPALPRGELHALGEELAGSRDVCFVDCACGLGLFGLVGRFGPFNRLGRVLSSGRGGESERERED